MPSVITVKIDVTKVTKERLFAGKNGAKYLDLVLIPTPNDKFGNTHMAVEGVSKEERQAGKKGVILGNAKEMGSSPQQQAPARRGRPADDQLANRTQDTDPDSIPF